MCYRFPSILKVVVSGTASGILHIKRRASFTTSECVPELAASKPDNYTHSVSQDDIHSKPESKVNGINAWAARGIAGRGVLIDYHGWAQKKGIAYDPLSGHGISVDEVDQITKEYEIELRKGDIFMLRTGKSPRYSLKWQRANTSRLC